MENKNTFNLTESQFKKLYQLAALEIPEIFDDKDINKILIEIEKKMTFSSTLLSDIQVAETPSLLIIDDLEISIYQLTLLLTKFGYNVTIARTANEANHLYKIRKYEYVLLDLYMPDYTDGLELLTNFTAMEKTKTDHTQIVVISGTDDKKLIKECFSSGANEFIEKKQKWHNDILRYISTVEKHKEWKTKNVISIIENEERKIASINVINLHKEDIAQQLEKEVNYQINCGFTHLIINMENLYSINSKGISSLIASYKAISEVNGLLKLCNVRNSVNEVLSYVFLNNVLEIFETKEDALESFNEQKE